MLDARFHVHTAQFPPEVLPVVEAALEEAAWLIPGWCHNVTVVYESDGSTDAKCLTISADSAYRFAYLTVYPAWLDGSPEGRREDMLHEMLHISINPIGDYARSTLNALLADKDTFQEHVNAQLTARLESAVCDLAHQIRQKVPATSAT